MPTSAFSAIFTEIQSRGSRASLAQQLDWLQSFTDILHAHHSQFARHSAWHPLGIPSLRVNLQRMEDSPLAFFLNDKLKRILHGFEAKPDLPHVEQMVISSSFVIGTLVDMLDNPEQPFEVAALVYESQSMFDDWYDQLLEMTGLQKRSL